MELTDFRARWGKLEKETRRLVIMAEISKIRINNSMVPNFVMEVDHTL